MDEKFNLIEYLTSKRDKGIIIWLCNIGAEKYWHRVSSGVVDRNEDIIVNRVEEMNLLISREQDIVILRNAPDEEYLLTLKKMGFSIPSILTLNNSDLFTPISELILKDEKLLSELRLIGAQNSEVYFVPYGVTYLEEQIAEKAGLSLVGAPAAINAKVNDKIFNREISLNLNFPVCQGFVCKNVDEMRTAYKELTGNPPYFEKVIIKEPNGASGKGLYVIESQEKLESNLRLITRLSKGNSESKWLVEGWYRKKADLNYQIYISPVGKVDTFSIKQQLLRDTVYIGSKIPPELDSNVLKQIKDYGAKIGEYLYGLGYTGVAGIDSIITEDDVIIPIIEINGRFTLSTYISFLNGIMIERKLLSRYFKIVTDTALTYQKLNAELSKHGIAFDLNNRAGVFVYTAGTLPSEMVEGASNCNGRVFTIIAADNWDRVDEYNTILESAIRGMTN
ncbi:MAG: phosphoribosylaminoimidazole carboxylase synthetase [Eubacterium sp.]|jgi:predicted ATP-grasp superfamily ATP-dependent carboligase|nr:phosphoribosylaminoimidazole carboxylase synthetase [Eubacterium sp.]